MCKVLFETDSTGLCRAIPVIEGTVNVILEII